LKLSRMRKNRIDDLETLKNTVENLTKSTAVYLDKTAVIEKFGLKTAWQGIVYIFKIRGNPEAEICYAWSSPKEGSSKRRYYAVLKIPPIDSPEKAVRAAIVRDYKKKINES